VGVVEKDSNTLITAARDKTLKEWNISTCQCLKSHELPSEPFSMMKTRSNSIIICGLMNGKVELRILSDLSLITSLSLNNPLSEPVIYCIPELEDGTFVVDHILLLRGGRQSQEA